MSQVKFAVGIAESTAKGQTWAKAGAGLANIFMNALCNGHKDLTSGRQPVIAS